MKSIKNSMVADRGSTIKNAKIDQSVNIQKEKKKSFFKGFFSGIFASLIASLIWFLLKLSIFNL